MYSIEVTARELLKLSKKIGWLPQPYEESKAADLRDQLERVWNPEDKKLLKPLTGRQIRFIQNETFLCQHSYPYWFETYARILHWDGSRMVTPQFNVAQRINLDIWAETEERGGAIANQQLKARQLGVSTETEMAVGHRVQFWPNTNAVVGSSDPDKSKKMAKMMENCWAEQPWWLTPVNTVYRAGELIEFGGHNSAVSIQHGNQFSGIARGSTPSVCHLSELPDFDDPENLIDAGLIKAMHPSPWMFLILESTAAGLYDWWHLTWEHSKEHWPERSLLRPVFLPWFIGSDIYPTKTWLHDHPIPSEWTPLKITEKHAERARAYVLSNKLLGKYLGLSWRMSREQMWFWEVEYQTAKDKKILAQFLQEMPADDTEAFQSTNTSIFDVDTITIYNNNKKEPWGVYGITGLDVPERMRPALRDVDSRYKPIQIIARWNPTIQPQEFELVPLKWNGYSGDDGLDKIYIWEPPQKDEHYGLGVDTSEGSGLDRSVVQGVRKGRLGHTQDAQVFEFSSPMVGAVDLWPVCMALGTLYSQPIFGEIRQPKMVIECLHEGDVTQLELRKRGWTNFHRWLRIDSKHIRPGKSMKLGWYTNAWSRPQMTAWLVKALRDQWLEINSPWFIHEMRTLERDEEKAFMKAVYGGHDDRLMALGIVFYSLWYLELRGSTQAEIAIERLRQKTLGVGDAVVYLPERSHNEPSREELIGVSEQYDPYDFRNEELEASW